jgi:hypothetical protein
MNDDQPRTPFRNTPIGFYISYIIGGLLAAWVIGMLK